MLKVIASDLDGTLFYPKRKARLLTRSNKDFLRRAIKNGKKLVLVSGRNYPILLKIAKKIDHIPTMIGCNGAFVSVDNKIVYENCMSHDKVRKLYYELKELKSVFAILIMTDKVPLLITAPNIKKHQYALLYLGYHIQGVYSEDYVFGEKKLEECLNDQSCHFYKVMPYFGYHRDAVQKAQEYSKIFNEKYGSDFEILWSHDSVEFMNKGVNKANALERFASDRNIDKDEVAVVGDSGNDIPMFKSFANSFVMENAPDEVKKYAKNEIKAVHEIEKFLD